MTEEVVEKKRKQREAVEVMARTETFTAGGAEYILTHQPMFKSREWRKKLGDVIRTLGPKVVPVGLGSNLGQFLDNMASVFEDAPEQIFDLIVEYDPKLNWGAIKDTIYPDELNTLFKIILETAFPLKESVEMAIGLKMGR